jgi:hypothetical protein
MDSENLKAPAAALCIKCGEPDLRAEMACLAPANVDCWAHGVWAHEDCLSLYESDQEAHLAEHGGDVLVRVELSADEYDQLAENASKAGLPIHEYMAKRLRERGLLGEPQQ